LQSCVADPGGNILIRGPLLLQGGLCHVEIFTIDDDRSLFEPSIAPKFDSYLSVGSVYDKNEINQNHNYNTTFMSYYEQIDNLKFDPSNLFFIGFFQCKVCRYQDPTLYSWICFLQK
jgi:hypothetical protein